MANEIASKWYYPLTEVSQDKRVPLPAVSPGYAAELSGFDGQLHGGLRPFSGFSKIHELDFTSESTVGTLYHSTNSQVTDFFPLTFNIDFDTYGYGFVYRVQRPNNNATTTWTFSGAAAVNSTVKLISSDGTTKIYKSVAGGTNGAITAAVSGSATFTFNAAGTVGGTIRLTSTDGTVKTYVGSSDSSDANGQVNNDGKVVYLVGASNSDSANAFKAAVESVGGHGTGKLTVSVSTGQVTITQATAGIAGNTSITTSTTPDFKASCSVNPPSAFTLGEDATVAFNNGSSGSDSATNIKAAIEDGTNGHTTSKLTVVAASGKVTITQVTQGIAGNSVITASTSFDSSCSINASDTFTGGSSTSEADIFLDFYLSECSSWTRGNLIKSGVSSTESIDVESCGRMVFIGITGFSPILFYVTDNPVGLDETSTSHALECPQGGWCYSSSDGSNYCSSTATMTFAPSTAGLGSLGSTIAGSLVFKFSSKAYEGSSIKLESVDGISLFYKAKSGATNGTTETIGDATYTLFNSGKTAPTATMTFSGAMTADETIKLIDANRVERTYRSYASATNGDVLSTSSSTATFTFGSPAVVGSTIQITDNAGTAVTKTYKVASSSDNYSNGFTDSTYVYFNAGSTADEAKANFIVAVNTSTSDAAIGTTASSGGTGIVILTQDDAGDGNTKILTAGSFTTATASGFPASFTGGGRIVKFQRGSSAANTAAALNTSLAHSNGHNGSITTGYSSGAQLNLINSTFDATSLDAGNTAITVSAGWNGDCSVNPAASFSNTETDANEATAASTNLKAAIDSTSGHNASLGYAYLDFTFSGAATDDGTLLIESSVGTNKTLTYKGAANDSGITNGDLDGTDVQFKIGSNAAEAATNFVAAINSKNGHNAVEKGATASFKIWDIPDNGDTIAITSTDGTAKTYIFSTSGITGDLDGSSNTIVRLKSGMSIQHLGNELLAAIDNSTNGHFGKIITRSEYVPASDPSTIVLSPTIENFVVTLTQVAAGASGNKTITYSTGTAAALLTGYSTAFTGGTVAWDGSTYSSDQKLNAVANADADGRVLLQQLETGTGGHTTVTDGASFDAAVDGSTASAFAGGSGGTISNYRFTVTANSGSSAGQVDIVQKLTGVEGNTDSPTFNGFQINCSPNVPVNFTGGGTTENGGTFTLINTDQSTFVYKFDTTSSDLTGLTDADGKFIIGIKDLSMADQVDAARVLITNTADSTNIDSFKAGNLVLGLRQLVGGTAGNTAVTVDATASKTITKTNFANGVGPDAVASETSEASLSCLNKHSIVVEETPGPGPAPLLDGPKLGWNEAYEIEAPTDTSISGNGRLILSTNKPNSGIYKSTGEPLYDGGYTIGGTVYYGGTNADIVDVWNTANPNNVIDCDGEYGGPDPDGDETAADDPDCTSNLEEMIPYIGIAPGGKPNPQAVSNTRRNICIYKLNTIPNGNKINQLPIVEIYTYAKTECQIHELEMEVYFRKKNDTNNPQVEGSPIGYGNWQPVASGVHLKNITAKSDTMFNYVSNSKGGEYAQYVADGGRDVKIAIEEKPGFAAAANIDADTCYVTWVNLEEYFTCDNFSPGDYQVKATIRTMCCNPTTYVSSTTTSFNIDSNLCNFETGQSATVSQVKDIKRLDKGNYIFSYLLYDSKTGRRSGLTKVLSVDNTDFTADKNYAFVDLLYDTTQYDHAYFYRSVNTLDAGGVAVAGILSLDRIAKLEDFITDFGQPTSTSNYRRVIYPYKLNDLSILYQPTYKTESPVFDESMPFGGALLWYGNTLLVSRIKNTNASSKEGESVEDIQRGIGELRWSSMLESSPEMFSPFNRFVPVVPSNEIIALKTLGDMVYGFSRDRAYNIRKDTGLGMGFMRIMDLHEGFGTTGANAIEGVGSSMYYMTPKGIKALSSKGQLDDVRAFDYHISKKWPRDLSNVQMSYDPTGSCLFVLHPETEEACCLWFNTGKATLLTDMAFTSTKAGPWPNVTTNFADDLVERGMFLQNPPTETGAQGFKPRVYVHDYKYEKTISGSSTSAFNGNNRITMLDGQGDTRFTTEGAVSSKTLTIDNADGTKVSNSWVGGYVYVMDSSTASYVGKKSKIIKIVNPDIDEITAGATSASEAILTLADTALDGLPDNSRVCFSPVYMRWVGHNVGVNAQDGTQYGSSDDYHTVKHMDSLSVMFTDVLGPPSTDSSKDNRFAGLAFKGSSLIPADKKYPTDLNNEKISSIVDGESIHSVAYGADDSVDLTLQGSYGVKGASIAPGAEVICPDLDFLLLSGIVMGKVLPTTRNSRPSIGT